jgi:tetraprenyl-beta-curcumene synthase
MREASDLRLTIRAGGALALMSALYWTTVIPRTRRQMRRWRDRAQEIPDQTLRAIALSKLEQERFNVQTAPTFATLAPRAYRSQAVEAIVALQVTYDYLDGVSEQPAPDPLLDGQRLFCALRDAVAPESEPHLDYYQHHPRRDDGGYLNALVATTRRALAQLPAHRAISPVAGTAAACCGEAQTRAHAVPRYGASQLERWAASRGEASGRSWREVVASAASAVISIHALIAAAADERTTCEQAVQIDAFHRSTCALATLLDGLADRGEDERSERQQQAGYLRHFPSGETLGVELAAFARRAMALAPAVPNAGHHMMTLAGVVAYYSSALEHGDRSAKKTVALVQRELQPLIMPTLTFMRAWRFAKRLRSRGAKGGRAPG